MSEQSPELTCEDFLRQVPELLMSDENIENQPHFKACSTCRSLLREIETIAEDASHFRFGKDSSGTDDWSETT